MQVESRIAAAMAQKQPKVLTTPADRVKPRLEHLAKLLKVRRAWLWYRRVL